MRISILSNHRHDTSFHHVDDMDEFVLFRILKAIRHLIFHPLQFPTSLSLLIIFSVIIHLWTLLMHYVFHPFASGMVIYPIYKMIIIIIIDIYQCKRSTIILTLWQLHILCFFTEHYHYHLLNTETFPSFSNVYLFSYSLWYHWRLE